MPTVCNDQNPWIFHRTNIYCDPTPGFAIPYAGNSWDVVSSGQAVLGYTPCVKPFLWFMFSVVTSGTIDAGNILIPIYMDDYTIHKCWYLWNAIYHRR